MVTIGSLRYDIVADTSKFTAGMVSTRSELSAAKKLFLETRTPAERLSIAQQGLANALRKGAITQDTYNRSLSQLKQQTAIAEGGVKGLVAQVRQQGSVVGTAIKGFVAYRAAGVAMGQVRDAFSLATELETTIATFGVLTGSVENATRLVADLRQYDLETTFGFADTTKTAETLLNFGVQTKDVIKTLRQLGDISGGSADRLSGLSLAFGKATTLGRLQREEVNMMIERGYNPMNDIAAATGETMLELDSRMRKGGVSSDELAAAIERATSAGGKFFGMVENRAKTTAGQIDLLRGEWDMLKTDIATSVLPAAKGGMSQTRTAVDFWKSGGVNKRVYDAVLSNRTERAFGVRTIGNTPGTMQNPVFDKIRDDYSRSVKDAQDKSVQDSWNSIEGVGVSLFESAKSTTEFLKNAAMGSLTPTMSTNKFMEDWMYQNKVAADKAMEQQKEAEVPKAAQIEAAAVARRGSREEYQLRSQMDRQKEQAMQQKKMHAEAQAKQDEAIGVLREIRDKQPEPVG